METPSSILAWKIPWTEEPEELQSMGSQTEQLRKKKIHLKLFRMVNFMLHSPPQIFLFIVKTILSLRAIQN